ncbi:MAG: glycosyltransferase family 4 protein [Anaerolineae bacterium]
MTPTSRRDAAPLRVTLINLWPRGGMAHYTAALANALAQEPDVRVTAVVAQAPAPLGFAPAVTLAPVDIPTGNRLADLARLPRQLLHLPAYLRTVQATAPDIIHANLSTHPWELATLPWLRRRWPLVVTQHEVSIKPGEGGWRKRWNVWAGPRYAHHLFVHGQALAAELQRTRLAPAARISVLAHGWYDFLTQWAGAQDEEPHTVLFFGRIKAYKGLEYLVEAMPLVQAAVPDVHFLVVGGEGDMAPYRRLPGAQAAAVTWVNRFVEDAEAAAFFRRASLVVLPYTDGSASGVIAAAYAFARPVIATRVGSLPEAVVDGVTGLLIPPRDAAALAAAISGLLSDDPRRRALGAAGRQWAQQHLSWADIAHQTVAVYRQLAWKSAG